MKQNVTKVFKRIRLTTNLFSFVYDKCISAFGIEKVIHQRHWTSMSEYLTWFQHVAKHEGARQASKLGKEARSQYLALMQGKAISPLPFRKSNADGSLKFVKRMFNSSGNNQMLHQLTLTALTVGKVLVLNPIVDLSSITEPFTGNSDKLKRVSEEITKLKWLKRATIPMWNRKIWYSNQSGPNGPSGWCSHLDAKALFYPDNREHLISLYELSKLTGSTELIKQAETLQSRFESDSTYKICRLEVIPDKEGKSRNIMIGNYFTQSVLKILHKDLMKILRRIPEDYTFSQNESAVTIRRWMEEGSVVNGYDLSSATERFPLSLQKEVISKLYGSEVGQFWEKLLTSLTFNYNGYDVKFGVGQPMGFYTSWSAFSLTHHAIIRIAALRAGVNPRDSYAIVGDDVVIKGTRLSNAYLELLQDIGVEVNLFKSTSFDGSFGIIEFLKRVYSPIGEITPLPLNSFLECQHNISTIIGLQDLLERFKFPISLVKEILSWLPIGNREHLIGAPIIRIDTEVPKNVSSGNTDAWQDLAQSITLRWSGGNKGPSWIFSDREIITAFTSVIRSIIEKNREDYRTFAMNVFEDSSAFIAKLAGKSRVFNKSPLPPAVMGDPMSISVLHPILLVLNEDFGEFFDVDLFLDQIQREDIDLSVPIFKRLTSLSSDRYLKLSERQLKQLSTLIFKVYGLLNSTSKTSPTGLK